MRLAKYDANPENPAARETLRFRFSDQELEQVAHKYAKGDPTKLRFRLEVTDTSAMLVPTKEGGMAVTRSPSGKNHPWEVGFNHRSSPAITKLRAIPTSEAEMMLQHAFLRVKLPRGSARTESGPTIRGAPATEPRVVSAGDFSADLRSPADMELLRQAVRTVNEVASRIGVPLDVVGGRIRAYLS